MACVFGYLLSLGRRVMTQKTLESHKWQGIGVALFAWVAWSREVRKTLVEIIPFAQLLYLPALGVALVLLLAAGHLGGKPDAWV